MRERGRSYGVIVPGRAEVGLSLDGARARFSRSRARVTVRVSFVPYSWVSCLLLPCLLAALRSPSLVRPFKAPS